MIDIATTRKDFPILQRKVNDEPLIYLDNAATTQKPISVISAIETFYRQSNANIHRGVHTLAQEATEQYERAREILRLFINARSTKEVLFTRGATTGLNWVAKGYVAPKLQTNDEIVISPMEHHSNLVVWQQIARSTGAKLLYMPLLNDGRIDMGRVQQMITKRTKVMAITHVSNVLGVVNDVKQLAEWIHAAGGIIIVDGAQAAPHMTIDVQALDCDFYAFSGHKMLAPTGIGILYGKESLLEQMEPQEFGGEMIEFVYEQTSTWNELPWKFEAGTPNIVGGIALAKAVEYLSTIGMDKVAVHEQQLMEALLPRLARIEGLTIYGPVQSHQRSAVVSFNMEGIHPHDIATALDMQGIAVRAGHHCAQPLMKHLQVPATVRASFYLYNSLEEVDAFVTALVKVKEYFANGTI